MEVFALWIRGEAVPWVRQHRGLAVQSGGVPKTRLTIRVARPRTAGAGPAHGASRRRKTKALPHSSPKLSAIPSTTAWAKASRHL